MGVASLIFGILSIICAIAQPYGMGMAAIGIFLAVVARQDPEKKGLATGGLVCSILGLIFGVLMFVACNSRFG